MDNHWVERQHEMEGWYEEFARDEARAIEALRYEYAPYVRVLKSLHGRVLDMGGGAGFAGAYLDAVSDYTVVDPSTIWEDPKWLNVTKGLSPNPILPTFVQGVGEDLPFEQASFDAVVAFWSLNHASDAELCVKEIARVLKSGGKALLVLEDMEPTWLDTINLGYQEIRRLLHLESTSIGWNQSTVDSAAATATHKLLRRPWPLQADHTRIREMDLTRWLGDRFRMVDRNWIGGFLSIECERVRN